MVRPKRDDMLDQFQAGIEQLTAKVPSLHLDLDWLTVIGIVSQLQLALRHPLNRGDRTARAARELIDKITAQVEAHAPALAAIMRLGDDPKYDR